MGIIGVDDDEPSREESDDSDVDLSVHLDCEPQGAWVTAERVEKIADMLESDEQVHYLIRCNAINVTEGHVPTGSNSYAINSMRGYNRAAFTDRRVLVKVPTFLKTQSISLPYDNIEHVQIASGLLHDQISIQAVQDTYDLNTLNPEEAEIEEAANFLNRMITERDQDELTVTEREEDPYEELQKLKGLYDEEIITQAEFEAKKTELLDQI